ANSYNIPAVKALYLLGLDPFLEFAKRMGYTTFEDRSRFGLAVALGGGEVTLLEHTSAYATLANEGVRHAPVPVLKVESPSGEVLYEWKESPGERIIDQNIARMTSNVLSDDVARQYIFGAGSLLQLGGRPVSAKTGTTNDYHDAWTMGYTPSIAVGVWGGNNDNRAMGRGSGGTMVTGPVWNTTIRVATDETPVESFGAPEILKLGKPVLDGEIGSPKTVVIDRITGKLATDETPVRLREERTYVTHHNILHYVDPANPTGPEPGAGSRDPMYPTWEQGVQDWVRRKAEETGQPLTAEEPPTEYDDVHVAANIPDVDIRKPESGALESRSFAVEARVSARREVQRVEVYVDSFFLGATTHSPYGVNVTIPSFVSAGDHTLRVVAFDDVENEGSESRRIDVPSAEAASIQITDPRPGQIIVASSPTFPVRVEMMDPSAYSRIDFYVGPRVGGGGRLVGSLAPSNAIETFTWTLPPPGEYIFSAFAVRADTGEEVSAGNVLLEVEAMPAVPAMAE
ncbi:MAG: Ig-like domain-containing protein, partial [Patescibacteria group bacterium]